MAFFFVYGLSDDDGHDEFVLSLPSWRSSSRTLSVNCSTCPTSRSTGRACSAIVAAWAAMVASRSASRRTSSSYVGRPPDSTSRTLSDHHPPARERHTITEQDLQGRNPTDVNSY
ncbi:hypothetical protein UK99_13205 [Frankia casuarinae]|nr:hypothetical protein UK99_13205 [Frankia casuarinae]